MPSTDSEENGVKVESQSCDLLRMPPKKRHLHKFQSMTRVSQSLNLPRSGSEPQYIPSSGKTEYVSKSQMACSDSSEEATVKKTSDEREGSPRCQDPFVDDFHNLREGQPLQTDATADSTAVDGKLFDVFGKQLDGDGNLVLTSREKDLQTAFPEANKPCLSGSLAERIPGDQSACQKVEGKNSNRPSEQLDSKRSIVKQEKLDFCFGLSKGPMSLHCKMEDSHGSHEQSIRSNWDLNTVMDSWENPRAVASEYHAEGGKYSQVSCDHRKNEMRSSLGIQSHENSPAIHINFRHSSGGAGKVHPKLEEPYALHTPDTSDLKLPAKQLNSLGTLIKSEPHANFGHGDKSEGEEMLRLLVSRAVKPEPCELVVKECPNVPLPKKSEACGDRACIPAAKLDPQNLVSLKGFGTMNDGALPHLMPANGDEPGCSSGNVSSLSDFTSADQTADGSNLDPSQVHQGCCASHVSAVSSESNLESAYKFPNSYNKMPRNPSPSHLLGSSHTTDHARTVETVSQTDDTISNPAPTNTTDSQFTESSSPTASECKPNVGENPQVIPEAALSMPPVLSSLDQGVSKSAPYDSNSECEQNSDFARNMKVDVPENPIPKSNSDISTSLPSETVLPEKSSKDMNGEEMIPKKDVTGQSCKEELHVHQSPSNPQGVVATQLRLKPRMDEDDDIEDGEVRDLNVQQASRRTSTCGGKERVQPGDGKETVQTRAKKQPGGSVDSVSLPSASLLKGETVQVVKNQENAQSSLDSSCNTNDKNVGAAVKKGCPGDVKSEAVSGRDQSKSKVAKNSGGKTSSKEKCNATKQHGKSSSGNYKASVDDRKGEVGGCTAEARESKVSGERLVPLRPKSTERANESNGQRSSSRSRIVRLTPDRKDHAGKDRSTERKSLPSRVERERSGERSSDRSFKVEASSYRRGTRNENCNKEWQKFDKDGRKDEVSNNKADNDTAARGRGRSDKHLGTLRGDWNPNAAYVPERRSSNMYRFLKSRNTNTSEGTFAGVDISAEHSGRTIRRDPPPPMDDCLDGLSRTSHRRSPGTRNVQGGIHIIRRRQMRDVSPQRCPPDGAPNLRLLGRDERFVQRMAGGDMVDPSAMADAHPNYSREGAFMQRGRSISPPLLRRGPSRLTRLRSPPLPSTRRVRSPRQWSPQNSLDGFDMHREAIGGRSPNLRVVRVRTPPHPRDCFMDGVQPPPGRRCASPPPPCLPRLRDDIRGVGPPREFEYARGGGGGGGGGIPLQRNVRRLRLMDARLNNGDEDYFDLMHSRPHVHELLEEDDLGSGSGRRVTGERHGIVRPLRRRYGNAGEEDLDFQMEHEGPRPIRFQMGEEEEFMERGRPRVEGIRNRLGEHPRRLRGMEERDDGRAWHNNADLDDSRIKRRRF